MNLSNVLKSSSISYSNGMGSHSTAEELCDNLCEVCETTSMPEGQVEEERFILNTSELNDKDVVSKSVTYYKIGGVCYLCVAINKDEYYVKLDKTYYPTYAVVEEILDLLEVVMYIQLNFIDGGSIRITGYEAFGAYVYETYMTRASETAKQVKEWLDLMTTEEIEDVLENNTI